MPEQLGDALLYLRTDDKQFTGGVEQAKRKAEQLGGTLDKTTASAGTLSRELDNTGRAAARSGGQLALASNKVTTSIGGQRAGLQQLIMNLNDVSTMYSLGMRPAQIYGSQIGQVTQAVMLMAGTTSKFATFMMGGWGIAIQVGVMVLGPLISQLLATHKAAQLAEEGTDALGKAQSVLGGVFDLTSGKIKSQNELLILNARLMALNLRATAISKRASAQATYEGAGQRSLADQFAGASGMTAGLVVRMINGSPVGAKNAAAARNVVRGLGQGTISREEALKRSEKLDFRGVSVTRTEFQQAIIDSATADLNEKAAKLIDQSLDSGSLASELRQPGRARHDKKNTGPTADEKLRHFEDMLDGYRTQIASAEAQMAMNAQEEAEFSLRRVENERRQTRRSIEADDKLEAADKKRLLKVADEVADAERSVVEFRRKERVEQEAQQLADQQYQATEAGLHAQLDLAETQADRQRLALKIFDAETAYLKSKLEAVTASETATDAEKQRAAIELKALETNTGARRQGVAQANEGDLERYIRSMSPATVADRVEAAVVDELEAVRNGIDDAIYEALGVKDPLLKSLIDLLVQQLLIRPMAEALQKAQQSSAGGGGGLLKTLLGLGGAVLGGGAAPSAALAGDVAATMADPAYAGLFASGGLIPAGQWGIVGENGPERVIGTSLGARIQPNSSLRKMDAGGGMSLTQNIMIPERADPRRTPSGIARATQGVLARAAGKGLATGPRFNRS